MWGCWTGADSTHVFHRQLRAVTPLRLVRQTPITFLMKHLHSDIMRVIVSKTRSLNFQGKGKLHTLVLLQMQRQSERTDRKHTQCCTTGIQMLSGCLGYLDEAGSRVPPLLKVLLPMLLLHLQGKTRAEDALGNKERVHTET